MLGSTFYHSSFRNATIAFGHLFSNITIERVNKAGEHVKTIKIPLTYSEKENFVSILYNDKVDNADADIQTTLPRMGYSIGNIQYDSSRKLNTIDKLSRKDKSRFMFNRVPYNVSFELYIGTRRLDDGYRIIEQILPYFTPELNIRVKEHADSEIISNIPFVLSDVNQDVVVGTMEERRNIMWTLSFTAKLNLYTANRDMELIKNSIIDINSLNTNALLEQYMTTLDPVNAGIEDEFKIIDRVSTSDFNDFIFTASHGEFLDLDFDKYDINTGAALTFELSRFQEYEGYILTGSELMVNIE